MTNENFFDKAGLEVTSAEVEVGSTYPIYGMITNILNDKPGSVEAEINFNIIAKMSIDDAEKVELLKQRAFDPGIFVSTVTSKEDKTIFVDVSTVIYGRKDSMEV